MSKEYPILFTGPMVRAILDGTKSQTRRVIKPQPTEYICDVTNRHMWEWKKGKGRCAWAIDMHPKLCARQFLLERSPYGVPGDALWVRENIRTLVNQGNNKAWEYGEFEIEYRADGKLIRCPDEREEWWRHNWHVRPATTIPAIHMPRWACRLFLKVKAVRVERVQEITNDDAKAEGVRPENAEVNCSGGAYKNGFVGLWDSINAKRGFGWDTDPWVWVIEFKFVE